jgi:hypothetical protein
MSQISSRTREGSADTEHQAPKRPALRIASIANIAASPPKTVVLEQYLAHLIAEIAAVRAELGCAADHVPAAFPSAESQAERAPAPSARAERMVAALTAARHQPVTA